jgi:hypothetical protein
MLRACWTIAGTCIALVGFVSIADAANELRLSGSVLKLSEITDKTFAVNTGGLVVVIVRDSGSRPPQDIKVDAPRAFQALGVVRGTQTDRGQALMGGGYTWYLFTPVAAGDTNITVSYGENGGGGKKVERSYKVKVTERD